MSRWLKSVNNLLENLDQGVGEAVDQKENLYYEDEYGVIQEVGGESSVDDILAKRGLLENELDDAADNTTVNDNTDQPITEEIGVIAEESLVNDDEIELLDSKEVGDQNNIDSDDTLERENAEDTALHHDKADAFAAEMTTKPSDMKIIDQSVDIPSSESQNSLSLDRKEEGSHSDVDHTIQLNKTDMDNPPENNLDNNVDDGDVNNVKAGVTVTTSSKTKISLADQELLELKEALANQEQVSETALKDANNLQKELRKHRRHIVKLNTDLNDTERELDAQRTELERAAVRIEKDRLRNKEEKEQLELSHKKEIENANKEHQSIMESLKSKHAEQIADMESRLERAEQTRAKEGGDMTMELAESASRERETLKKVLNLEEEKSTQALQISTLQTQMSVLQSRLETTSEAHKSAMEREREADDKLDAALALHARHLNQRQGREAELERTVADLSAALVVARQKEVSESKVIKIGTATPGNSDENVTYLNDQLSATNEEVETLKVQLMLERERSKTLQQELEDISRERTQELSSSQARQKQYDRKIADLESAMRQLKSSLRSAKNMQTINTGQADIEQKELRKEISTLSEELIRQRSKLESASTETLALRNRLRVALARAEDSEKNDFPQTRSTIHDIERGNVVGFTKVRRRLGERDKLLVPSIRNAIKFDPGRGETKEHIGALIDVLDNWAVDTGAHLRYNPLSRGGFIIYFLILHIWTFSLVIYHTNSGLAQVNCGEVHSPQDLIHNSYRHIEQLHG